MRIQLQTLIFSITFLAKTSATPTPHLNDANLICGLGLFCCQSLSPGIQCQKCCVVPNN
ncbi:hypothetical protein CPB84DRAFT_1796216 [Gymnopilus junonius]|uniref:Uncharacterized protein n=1 Tax=Gymnopilus junonius TaxID=109634 RepID=A0A9P5NCM6_GYMJU|nr:hypothetical protein CPB84DRAFT_1796216 [Gymnopilus junonius]